MSGIVEVAAGLAAGGAILPAGFDFSGVAAAEAAERLTAFLKAAASECSMMARCCGKTNVHNLEPEDLRTSSLRAPSGGRDRHGWTQEDRLTALRSFMKKKPAAVVAGFFAAMFHSMKK